MSPGARGVVLHLAPHADDELIGAPATLMALRDGGWQVVNLVCSLGRAEERSRRRRELQAACAAAGFELEVVAEPIDPLARGNAASQVTLEADLAAALHRHRPTVVVAPSPHDRHPGHEIVGRAALTVCAAAGAPGAGTGTEATTAGGGGAGGTGPSPRLWLWGLWGDLPFPTMAVGFGEERLAEVLDALQAHAGELGRNDYGKVVRGRAEMLASLGPERVFGFGSEGSAVPYVELLCEVLRSGGRWYLGTPRWLDAEHPLGDGADEDGAARSGVGTGFAGPDVTEWLEAPSLTTRYGPPPGAG